MSVLDSARESLALVADEARQVFEQVSDTREAWERYANALISGGFRKAAATLTGAATALRDCADAQQTVLRDAAASASKTLTDADVANLDTSVELLHSAKTKLTELHDVINAVIDGITRATAGATQLGSRLSKSTQSLRQAEQTLDSILFHYRATNRHVEHLLKLLDGLKDDSVTPQTSAWLDERALLSTARAETGAALLDAPARNCDKPGSEKVNESRAGLEAHAREYDGRNAELNEATVAGEAGGRTLPPVQTSIEGHQGSLFSSQRRTSGGRKLPMSAATTVSVARRYGIDVKGVRIQIRKNHSGYCGVTNEQGHIALARDAFSSEEELARTLFHEMFHRRQLKRNGGAYPEDDDEIDRWEEEAYAEEEKWWQGHPLSSAEGSP